MLPTTPQPQLLATFQTSTTEPFYLAASKQKDRGSLMPAQLPVSMQESAMRSILKFHVPPKVTPSCIQRIACDAASFRANQIKLDQTPPESVERALDMLALSQKYAHHNDESNASYFLNAAQEILSLSQHQNNPTALLELGRLERSKKEDLTANLYFTALVRRFEDAEGQYELSRAYRDGLGFAKNEEKYLEYLKMAAEGGSTQAQYEWGMRYRLNPHPSPFDQLRAFLWLKLASDQNQLQATFELGKMSSEGFGVPKDNAKAFNLIREAADKGLMDAQYALGLMYTKSKKNLEALHYFMLAAKQGNLGACCEVGLYYLTQYPNDKKKCLFGLKFITQAAHGMVPWAQYKLGSLYMQGLQVANSPSYVVHSDLDEAIEWLQKASDAQFEAAKDPLQQAIALKAKLREVEKTAITLKRKAETAIKHTPKITTQNASVQKKARILPKSVSNMPLAQKNPSQTPQDSNNIRVNFPIPTKSTSRRNQFQAKPLRAPSSPASHHPEDLYEEGFPVGFDMNKHPSEFWK